MEEPLRPRNRLWDFSRTEEARTGCTCWLGRSKKKPKLFSNKRRHYGILAETKASVLLTVSLAGFVGLPRIVIKPTGAVNDDAGQSGFIRRISFKSQI